MCELLWSDPQPQVQCMYSYIDLARAKSKALVSVSSLIKQNIKSCNAKWRRFVRAAHFLVHFFAVVLHDYNVKLPETS